jgi:glutamate/tyrosine decarboxylase-like PLP-dependent enzyme
VAHLLFEESVVFGLLVERFTVSIHKNGGNAPAVGVFLRKRGKAVKARKAKPGAE